MIRSAKIVRHSRFVTSQMAGVAIDKRVFSEILCRIERLHRYAGQLNAFFKHNREKLSQWWFSVRTIISISIYIQLFRRKNLFQLHKYDSLGLLNE